MRRPLLDEGDVEAGAHEVWRCRLRSRLPPTTAIF
jgi:hypothetical protein